MRSVCTPCACECACTCECAHLPTAFQTALETGLENAYFEYLWGDMGDRMRKDQVSTLAAAGVTLASGWWDWAPPSRGTEASRGEEVHTLWGPALLPSALQVPLSPAGLCAGQTLIGNDCSRYWSSSLSTRSSHWIQESRDAVDTLATGMEVGDAGPDPPS